MRRKKVLAVLPKGGGAPAMVAGLRAAARALRWDFLSMEYRRAPGDAATSVFRAPLPVDSIPGLVEALAPDGVVAVATDDLPPGDALAAAGAVPVVFAGRPFGFERERCAYIRHETETTAALATRHLLLSGFGDYAYLPWWGAPPWSAARGDAFRRCVERAGRRFHAFPGPAAAGVDAGAASDPISARGEILRRWLAALPKPCGVLAANDVAGEELLVECARLGLAVPDDVAVLGIDDAEHICEATSPTLSSVALDFVAYGRTAMRLLADWADGLEKNPAAAPPPPRTVPPLGVTVRASTRFVRDRRVAAALEFVRIHACEEGFGPRHAVARMGLGRSRADELFRAVLGRTVLDEIHAARLDRAKALLSEGVTPGIVAARCGYASESDFRRVFRRRVGQTVRRWTLARLGETVPAGSGGL